MNEIKQTIAVQTAVIPEIGTIDESVPQEGINILENLKFSQLPAHILVSNPFFFSQLLLEKQKSIKEAEERFKMANGRIVKQIPQQIEPIKPEKIKEEENPGFVRGWYNWAKSKLWW